MLSINSSPVAKISVEEVATLCFDKYKLLPKTGKPNNKEWTVLAGVVLYDNQTVSSQVISLGCGTKCIGKSKLCSQGLILNDSHAEVLARRGLMRYIYHQLKKAFTKNESIFLWLPEMQKFDLKDKLSFHFFSTQTPCGDACIIAANETEQHVDEPLIKKSKITDMKIVDDKVGSTIDYIYTGAKLIGSNNGDVMEQVVGAVRTKPGKGERTLSMSCSDKLAKWQIMGVQGALLDFLITKPIYFDTLNFWGENNLVSLERAIWKRFHENELKNTKYKLHTPKIQIFNNPKFSHAQDSNKRATPNGIVWCDIPSCMKPYEISVNGKRQGTTVKNQQSPQSALKISKFFLFRDFMNIIELIPDIMYREKNQNNCVTYMDYKFLAKDYQSAWSEIKMNYFKQWTKKPDNLLKFSIKEDDKDKSKTLIF